MIEAEVKSNDFRKLKFFFIIIIFVTKFSYVYISEKYNRIN